MSVQTSAGLPVVSAYVDAAGVGVPVDESHPLPIGVSVARVGAHTHLTGAGTLDAGQTLAAPAGARSILLQALTQNVRYTLDGSAPGANNGFRLTAGNDPVVLPIGATETLKVISETAGAVLEYQWLG